MSFICLFSEPLENYIVSAIPEYTILSVVKYTFRKKKAERKREDNQDRNVFTIFIVRVSCHVYLNSKSHF